MDKKYCFIVNTHSRTGQAAAVWEQLETELRAQKVSYEVYMTEYAGHGMVLAEELTASGKPLHLVVAGGDGTVNEVLNGIQDLSKVTFGYLPLGSANDFARGLGLTEEPLQLLRQMLSSAREDVIDVGEVIWRGGRRRFVISAGVGVDAAVCRKALTSRLKAALNKLHLGSLTYGLLTISQLFLHPKTTSTAVLSDGRKISMPGMIFSAAMNFPWEGGGVPMVPGANARDGKLSVCCVHDMNKLFCLFAFVLLIAGKHERLKGFTVVEAQEIQIFLERPMVVHADGEDCGDRSELTFRCLPGALHMLR